MKYMRAARFSFFIFTVALMIAVSVFSVVHAQDDAPLAVTCEPNTTEAFIDELVRWSAEPEGGTGDYSYAWSGSEGLEGDDRSERIRYQEEGEKTASVTVTSGDETVTVDCEPSVTVRVEQLIGSCEVDADSSGNQHEITWEADADGGTGEYTFSWTGTDDLDGDADRVTKTYDSSGVKTGTVTIASGGQEIELSCEAQLTDRGAIPEGPDPFSGECDVSGSFVEGGRVRWTSRGHDGPGEYSYSWTGTGGLSGTDSSESIEYETEGVKTGTVTITSGDEPLDFTCAVHIGNAEDSSGGGGCFIATAAYGTSLAGDIDVLRDFRDTYLVPYPFGEKVVSAYYEISPTLAELIAEHNAFRAVTRTVLQPLVVVAEVVLN